MKTMKIEGNYCRLEIGSILEGGFQAYLKTFENQVTYISVELEENMVGTKRKRSVR